MRINEKMKWEAIDFSGEVYQYENVPKTSKAMEAWQLPDGEKYAIVKRLNCIVPNWEETLRYIGDEPTIEEIKNLRPCVLDFAQAMEIDLRNNDHNETNGWRLCRSEYLMHLLEKYILKLKEAMASNDDQTIKHESVSVANFAMMIFDIINRKNV